jgi:hypothetical protein
MPGGSESQAPERVPGFRLVPSRVRVKGSRSGKQLRKGELIPKKMN